MSLSLALAFQIFRGKIATPEGAEPGEKIEKTDFKTFSLVIGSLLAFLFLIERAGFIIAASITFFGISVAFDNKHHWRSAIFGTLFMAIIYFIFTRYLNVQLPAGIFEGL